MYPCNGFRVTVQMVWPCYPYADIQPSPKMFLDELESGRQARGGPEKRYKDTQTSANRTAALVLTSGRTLMLNAPPGGVRRLLV